MRKASKERILEILGYYAVVGKEGTLKHFDIKEDTLRRYLYAAKHEYDIQDIDKHIALQHIAAQYTDKELKAIARGGRVAPGQPRIPIASFDGKHVKIGVMSDTQLGSIFTDPEYVYQAYEEFEKEKVDFVTHSGDVVEGMSHRRGHIYELSHIGYAAQRDHAIEVLSQCPGPCYYIDGNHDRWFITSGMGGYIVKDICDAIPDATYLGQDEGDISLNGQALLKLWHGGDGNTYALSYRVQKIVESLSGGEKPNVLFAAHTHKAFYIFERNIHCYSTGGIQKQTKWMRGKRIAAHVGFWIIEIWTNEKGVAKTRGMWYPFYS